MKLILYFFLFFQIAMQSQNFDLSGYVLDEKGLKMSDVEIVLNNPKYHTTTTANGTFEFKSLPKGTYHLDAYFLGYKTFHLDIYLQSNQKNIVIQLVPETESLNEVEIHSTAAIINQKNASLTTEIVNSKYIQMNLKTSLMKTLEELPGVSTIDVGSGQSKPVIRGLSFNQVVVVENGIKHEGQQWGEDHGLEIDPYAVKQVEIIKGPASLLYGSDAIGGVVLINNAAFPTENGTIAQLDLNTKTFNASYGGSFNLVSRKNHFYTDNRFSFNDYADYKVPTDTIDIYSYRADLKDRRLRNTAGQDVGLSSQIGWINDKHHTRAYLSYYAAKNAFFANAHGLEPRFVNVNLHDASNRDIQDPYQQVQHYKIVVNSTFFGENGKWDFELGYQKNYRQELSAYVNHGYMPAIFPDNLPFDSNLERLYDKDILSANLFKKLNRHTIKWQWGINADWQKNKINGWSFIIPAFTKWGIGGFIFGRYDFNDKLNINSGLRYDMGSIDITENRDWFTSETTAGDEIFLTRANAIHKKYNNLTWAIGLTYNQEHFSLKTNIGKSFRMPIPKEIASNGVNYHHFSYEVGKPNLQPEVSYQGDLGLEWNYKKWALQMSPFINYFPNYIYLNPTSNYDYLYGAGNQIYEYTEAKVFRWGMEYHGHYNFSEQWKIDVIAEYVYAKQLSGAKKGFGLPFAPPGNVIFKLSYQTPDFSLLRNTSISITNRYTMEQNSIVPPEKTTPDSSVFDFGIQTEIKAKQPWKLSLQINNLLNELYFNHTNYYRIIGVPESGRNLTVSLNIPLR